MVFSPWYNYGMYSEVIKPQNQYTITKVYADDKLLTGNQFTPQQWDRIHFNLQLAAAAKCNAHFYSTQVKRIYQKFHLPTPDSLKFINKNLTTEEIETSNRKQIASWLKCSTVTTFPLQYIWDDKVFIFKDSLPAITSNYFLCK